MKWWLSCALLAVGCMPDSITIRPIGRVSEPSHNVAPRGAMLRADNCVIREPGVVSPVPDTVAITSSNGPSSTAVFQQSPQFDNGTTPEILCHLSTFGTSPTQSGVRKTSAMGTEITYTDQAAASSSIEYYDHGDGITAQPMYEARGNLYIHDQRGVYKWTATSETTLRAVRDGTLWIHAEVGSSGSGFLPTANRVGYRFVVVYEDDNGVIRRSAPSVLRVVDNTSGSDQNVTVYMHVARSTTGNSTYLDDQGVKAIELYRTRTFSTSTELPNELYLVRTYTWVEGSVDSELFTVWAATGTGHGYYGHVDGTVTDSYEDTELSSSLYTSTSQDGAIGANVTPPSALYHAHFKGYEFWGNVAEKEFFPRVKVTAAPNTLSHEMTTATRTSGSPTLTGVTAINGAEVGMLLEYYSGTGFPIGTYITAISGSGPYTVTLSANATSNGTQSHFALDAVYVRAGDGSTQRFPLYEYNGVSLKYFGNTLITNYGTLGGALVDLWDEIGSYINSSRYTAADLEFLLGVTNRSARMGPSQMWVSNPSNIIDTVMPDLATSSGAPTTGGLEALPALHKRRIVWSKHQEPEVTTLTSSVDVGGPGDIVGLGALKDCLIILKTDGVYRLTGSGGNWRIDPLDTSVRPIGGRSTQVMGDAVYTLGDRGLLRITSSSVENLTQNVVGDWFYESDFDEPRLEDVRRYMLNNDGYHPMTLFSAADESNQEYVLCCEGSDSPLTIGVQSTFLVFNANTGAFYTWTLHEGNTVTIGSLGYARGNIASLSGNQAPGITIGRTYSSVDTSAAVHMLDNRQDSKDAGYSTYTQDIEFRALHEGDPTHIKRWQSLVYDVDGDLIDTVTATFRVNEGEAEVTQAVDSVDGDELRVWPPISVARSTKLVAGLTGAGITVYGMRGTFHSSGRKSPL